MLTLSRDKIDGKARESRSKTHRTNLPARMAANHPGQGPEPIDVIIPRVATIMLAVIVTGADGGPAAGVSGPLDQQLRREDPSALARDARLLGDARRGALVFYQPALTCTRCHVNERADAPPPLGPDLAALGKDVSDVELVEGILEPSKAIKKGYESITIATDDGRTINGLLAEE